MYFEISGGGCFISVPFVCLVCHEIMQFLIRRGSDQNVIFFFQMLLFGLCLSLYRHREACPVHRRGATHEGGEHPAAEKASERNGAQGGLV